MLLTIIIVVLLGLAIYRGLHRGLIVELLYSLGYIAVFIFARMTYQTVGVALANLTGTTTTNFGLANSIAFLLLTAIGWMLIHFIARLSRYITFLPVIHQANGLAGGIVGFVITYLMVFVVLCIGALLPVQSFQNQLQESTVAQTILTKTPVLTSNLLQRYLGHTDSNSDTSNKTTTDQTTNQTSI
ncbi:CvpA family protein [Loigolactobacillus backii]|uniref:CvpA family protein n=1 Tax=Loigolactobacillus backii TaxID=375175 RepID=UPI000834BB3B|nr:CvpA family protein [Loigolactobacillus backii]OLF70488.1 hypothetical protein ACX53_02465 [Loigolactobacillus backii]PIO87019.1 hypothetical protein B8A32_07655 [Loigolactobacillus backii]